VGAVEEEHESLSRTLHRPHKHCVSLSLLDVSNPGVPCFLLERQKAYYPNSARRLGKSVFASTHLFFRTPFQDGISRRGYSYRCLPPFSFLHGSKPLHLPCGPFEKDTLEHSKAADLRATRSGLESIYMYMCFSQWKFSILNPVNSRNGYVMAIWVGNERDGSASG
jgi:hypothetical protein